MSLLAHVLTGIVAFLHLWFLTLEMFLWRTDFGRKTFQMSREQAEATAVLAKNQGLYNGFLAAGLVWSLVVRDPGMALDLATFFLVCVIVAGIYGALTAKWSILLIQAVPAVAALVVVQLAARA